MHAAQSFDDSVSSADVMFHFPRVLLAWLLAVTGKSVLHFILSTRGRKYGFCVKTDVIM